MWRLSPAIFLVLASALAEAAEPVETAKETRKIVIDAAELNTKYEVRGPLGEVVTVVGQVVVSRRKSADPLFEVNAVNGCPLEHPVTMPYIVGGSALKEKLPLGKQCRLRAYQTCKLQGHRFDPTSDSEAVQQAHCKFVTSLVVIKRLKPDG